MNVNASNSVWNEDVKLFVKEYSQVESSWEKAKVRFGENLYGEGDIEIGVLLRVYKEKEQQGYIIYLYDKGIVEASFKGKDLAANVEGDIYYLFPGKLISKTEFDSIPVGKIDAAGATGNGASVTITDFNPITGNIVDLDVIEYEPYNTSGSNIIDLSSNYKSYSMSMSAKWYVDDVPDYLNNVLPNGCAPTAAAMLIAYYDNEIYNDLSTQEGNDFGTPYGVYRPMFPMSAQGDWVGSNFVYSSQPVEDLVVELGDYMHTCFDGIAANCGTQLGFLLHGLNEYFDDHNHGEFNAVYANINGATSTNEFTDFSSLVQSGNPALLWLDQAEYGGGIDHVVLAIGHYSAYMSPSGFIIHDDLTHGDKWISQDNVDGMIFMFVEHLQTRS